MQETREQFIERALADYESPLVGYAMNIVHDLERARDIVQDTFIRLCQQDLGKVSNGLKSWLYTVCKNRALDVLRKDRRMEPLDDARWKHIAGPSLAPDRQLVQDERLALIMHYLDRLTENQREVILLKFQQNLSYQEISDKTGLTSGNIGFLIHSGLKRLRDLLPADLMQD
ncbi:MAG: sigma-70 family RNA polymerase sigma factor [Verrucomicrobiales bacterium]